MTESCISIFNLLLSYPYIYLMSIKSSIRFIAILMVIIFSGCKEKAANMSKLTEDNLANSVDGQTESTKTSTNMTSKSSLYQVKDGNLSFETENIKKSRLSIDLLLQIHAGFIVKENLISFGISTE